MPSSFDAMHEQTRPLALLDERGGIAGQVQRAARRCERRATAAMNTAVTSMLIALIALVA